MSDDVTTAAGRRFLADLLGRYGGPVLDPTSHELTVSDVVAIETEARGQVAERLGAARAAIAERLRNERSQPPSEDGMWTEAYQEGLQYALDAIDDVSPDSAGKE